MQIDFLNLGKSTNMGDHMRQKEHPTQADVYLGHYQHWEDTRLQQHSGAFLSSRRGSTTS